MSNGRSDVLVVDDDADLRELMVLLLEGAGYTVRTARDGRDALARVSERMPSLILLDMKMPGMNGWQFAAAFREQHGRSTRIVVVPTPDTPTPILLRNSQSSTTCGSQAACLISETPGAIAAASSAVSVPVTDASYR